MATRKITNAVNLLKDKDYYSRISFLLFVIKENPKYSTLSELTQILDTDDFLKLCEYFGGMEIKIPTIEEFEYIINLIIIYLNMKEQNLNFESAVKKTKYPIKDIAQLQEDFESLQNAMDKYHLDEVF